jgi:hypothetical protein
MSDGPSVGGLNYEQSHLVKMANQIAANIPARSEIPAQIAAHIRNFWTPAMRADLEFLAHRQPDLFEPDVQTAATLLRQGSQA